MKSQLSSSRGQFWEKIRSEVRYAMLSPLNGSRAPYAICRRGDCSCDTEANTTYCTVLQARQPAQLTANIPRLIVDN